MILAFDTHYFGDKAQTACVQFTHWTDSVPLKTYTETLNGIEPYVPGEFYKRELPCILSLLKKVSLQSVEAIVVDGFVVLDDDGSLGLGGHLYKALNEKVPVIGVAKTAYAKLTTAKVELLRGSSRRPLYITAMGMDVNVAAKNIEGMHGGHRIPTLLKRVDALSRQLKHSGT